MRHFMIIAMSAALLAGCSTGTTQGDRALVGGALGAGTGAVIGGLATRSGTGAAVGALIGGATGAVVGAGTTPQCPVIDRRTGRQVVDQYGRPVTANCP